jgi:hypothetical protein
MPPQCIDETDSLLFLSEEVPAAVEMALRNSVEVSCSAMDGPGRPGADGPTDIMGRPGPGRRARAARLADS